MSASAQHLARLRGWSVRAWYQPLDRCSATGDARGVNLDPQSERRGALAVVLQDRSRQKIAIHARAELEAIVPPSHLTPARDRLLVRRGLAQLAYIVEGAVASPEEHPSAHRIAVLDGFEPNVGAVKCRAVPTITPAHDDHAVELAFTAAARCEPACNQATEGPCEEQERGSLQEAHGRFER